MIRLDFGALAAVYVCLMLAPIFGAWALNELRRSRRDAEAFRKAVRCRLCASAFREASDLELVRCPRCGALNERPHGPPL